MTGAIPPSAGSREPACIEWHLLWAVATAVALTAAVMGPGHHWSLNFLHVLSGLLWTGTDLFMGFVLGPILRRVDLAARRAIVTQLSPRTLFLMPTLAGVATATGIELALRAGYFGLQWPDYAWLLAALVVVALLTVQGIFILTPLNLFAFFELRKPSPDMARTGRLMRIYLAVVASLGVLQVVIIAIMARSVTGL